MLKWVYFGFLVCYLMGRLHEFERMMRLQKRGTMYGRKGDRPCLYNRLWKGCGKWMSFLFGAPTAPRS